MANALPPARTAPASAKDKGGERHPRPRRFRRECGCRRRNDACLGWRRGGRRLRGRRERHCRQRGGGGHHGRDAARRVAAHAQFDAGRVLRFARLDRDPQLAGPIERDSRARLAVDRGLRLGRQRQRLGRVAQVKLDRRAVGHRVAVAVEDDAGFQLDLAAHLDAARDLRGRPQADDLAPRRLQLADQVVVDAADRDRRRARWGELPEQGPDRGLQEGRVWP